jgi:hypothetical protein
MDEALRCLREECDRTRRVTAEAMKAFFETPSDANGTVLELAIDAEHDAMMAMMRHPEFLSWISHELSS